MTATSQKRAVLNHRSRLAARGIRRYEVVGLESDRDLIRSLARRLAENGPETDPIRSAVARAVASKGAAKNGGILDALRRSPLMDVRLDLKRPQLKGRKFEL